MASGRGGARASVAALVVCAALALTGCAASASVRPDTDVRDRPDTADTGSAPAQTIATDHPVSLVTIGDSIMTGNGLDPEQAWPVLLADHEKWQLTNLAEDGAGFLSVGDDGGVFADQVAEAELLPDPPSIIVVSASSNDLGEDPDEIEGAAHSAFASLRAAFPDTLLVGLSAIWGSDDPDEGLAPLNGAVERAALDEGAQWIDIGEPLLGHPELMQDDDVHPTAKGLKVMARAIEEDLRPFLDHSAH
ncbi:SGNH/GDSL hydrolase family protein [Cnuibacter sp. UC19_7]|uniref:SGNH/GDSL hydrolase family protein n=1 Tax=Cnuibacter sp. UC19_7 TaxID=3350166 RepID=UPI00366C63E0